MVPLRPEGGDEGHPKQAEEAHPGSGTGMVALEHRIQGPGQSVEKTVCEDEWHRLGVACCAVALLCVLVALV